MKMIECPECEGTGTYEILYCDTVGCCRGMSNDMAASMAGDVYEAGECEYCGGSGEVEEDEDERD